MKDPLADVFPEYVSWLQRRVNKNRGTRTKEECYCPADGHSDHGQHGSFKNSATKNSGALSSLPFHEFIQCFSPFVEKQHCQFCEAVSKRLRELGCENRLRFAISYGPAISLFSLPY